LETGGSAKMRSLPVKTKEFLGGNRIFFSIDTNEITVHPFSVFTGE
jgi:hypothetical protein